MTRIAAIGPLLLTVAGGVLYHLAAKSVPRTIDASLVLVVAYVAALAASLIAWAFLPSGGASSRPWHPAVIGIGLGAVLIELGYVLAYRARWPVSVASVIANGAVALLLVPVGLGIFGERLSPANLAGILLCVTGLALIGRE